jgi:hypothetical protein
VSVSGCEWTIEVSTYRKDGAGDDILRSSDIFGVVEFNTDVANILALGRHGLEGFDITTLAQKTLDFFDNRTSFDERRLSIWVVVDVDDALALIVADQIVVHADIHGICLGGEWKERAVGKDIAADIGSTLAVANVGTGHGEETTVDVCGVDPLDGRELVDLQVSVMKRS